VRDRELRRHAAEQQIPADESKRILDTVDPPAWGPAPPDATDLVKRCHGLRTKPLIDFTNDDLRFMIDQGIAVDRLVPRAIERLRPDALTRGDACLGDLLASVLGVHAAYWERFPDPDVSLRIITEELEGKLELEMGLRELIDAFRRDHSERRRGLWNGLTG
jgi:CDI immunity proteins